MKNLSLTRTKPSGKQIEKDTKIRLENFINSGRRDVKERQNFSKWFFDMGLVIEIDLYTGRFEVGIGVIEKKELVELDVSLEDAYSFGMDPESIKRLKKDIELRKELRSETRHGLSIRQKK